MRLRVAIPLLLLIKSIAAQTSAPKPPKTIPYEVVRTHELKPHRGSIPTQGITQGGSNQLHLILTVSPTGDVTHADAEGDPKLLKFWPELQGEVGQWRFTPFEQNGHPVTARIDEYVDLVPPERLPKTHIAPPPILPNSAITITLERSGCFGSCPAYSASLSTTSGIIFNGHSSVVASGQHTAQIDADAVRKLARQFVAADFYSMDPSYVASVTDCPTYQLSLTIDGHTAHVTDYMGQWIGMPAIIADLEDQVDEIAGTQRWIEGTGGLVPALLAEKFTFASYDAQQMLKQTALRGETDTVSALLGAGVPLDPLPAPATAAKAFPPPINSGWLTSASSHPDTLHAFIRAGASKHDQGDKDLALLGAARAGDLEAVRALIAYGANPKADLSHATATESTITHDNAGSALIAAATSGNPEVVREILSYHPDLEARAADGKTAIFAAAEYDGDAEDEARVECVRLLVKAGANVNARDKDGNTALHETFLTPVEEELLKLGADVNARNNDGETPIFTTVDKDAIPLLAAHGANLSIRNHQGQTALEASGHRGLEIRDALITAASSAKAPQ